jgi:Holliday junction resolvase
MEQNASLIRLGKIWTTRYHSERPAMSGTKHRRKGDRSERELIEKHRAIGVHAERYPASGATRFRGSGHDVDVYALGRDAAPLLAEVKARKNGSGFTTLEKWLGTYDLLALRRNNADPLIVVPWRTWAAVLAKVRGN